ncbi:Death on curing protein, Doc toxin [Enhygromyxa salina]|uniref:Death on curing protein, Doc toxin n=1 Tax=Enhygromyxa salina TaxID=215803 RepID=A0A0C1ZNF5_9BACT|nr:type II toxin-antitoxin system RelE/ParE family toxin [Enhygromyxa salina]KIG19004.1 Death on curing protein, Doc toxin [Enhygromyxa salina]
MTPKPLVWTDRALDDLEEIDAYIAADDPIAAERWVEGLLAAAQRAGELPMSGRQVPELGREDVREIIKRSYRIVYRILEDRAQVLTVFEGHRRLPPGLLDED